MAENESRAMPNVVMVGATVHNVPCPTALDSRLGVWFSPEAWASVVAMEGRIRELEFEHERLRQAAAETGEAVEQTLGKALGYPWYKDDPVNFPEATEADGVCVGEHVPESIALEAAQRILKLEAENAHLADAVRRADTWEARYVAHEAERDSLMTDAVRRADTWTARYVAMALKVRGMEAEVNRLTCSLVEAMGERDRLRRFFERTARDVWDLEEIDGGAWQDTARDLGLIVEVPADEEAREEYDTDTMLVWAWSPLAKGGSTDER